MNSDTKNSDKLDLTSFEKAFAALERSLHVVQNKTIFLRLDIAVQESVQAGLIQNFEVFFDFSIKMLKRALPKYQLPSNSVNMLEFKQLVRECHSAGLIQNPARWFGYRESRNITSHTFDCDKAEMVVADIPAFYEDAKFLLLRLRSLNESY